MIMELSGKYPVNLLCEKIGIPRSSFYNWKKGIDEPSEQKKRLIRNVALFREYHNRFPSHGYRWLNAKIKLDLGIVLSDLHTSAARLPGSRAFPSTINIRNQEIRLRHFRICCLPVSTSTGQWSVWSAI